MDNLSAAKVDQLKAEWTDQFVRPHGDRLELKRFEGRVGKVITVNWNGRALVDFADGGWYDIPADESHLQKVTADDAKGKYDAAANSAQVVPARQA